MHEEHEIETRLKAEARKLSKTLHGAPVVIIVGGSTRAGIPRTMTAACIEGDDVRLRDLLGLLQTSIQIETWKHMSWQSQPGPALKRPRRKRRAA